MHFPILFWGGFHVLIFLLLFLDLKVFHRKPRPVTPKEALLWTALWVSMALLFSVFIYFTHSSGEALQFLTGYLIEKTLSVDNMFIFLIVFSHFQVPEHLEHKVLFYGIIGALVMRLGFILAGTALVEKFYWLLYLFGLFLIITGIRLFVEKEKKMDLNENWLVRLWKRFFAFNPSYESQSFFTRKKGVLAATPLFLALLVIENSDLIFALDSIPAIFAITTDPFIVYTSNVFAILGLRSLHFVLSAFKERFSAFKYGLAIILVFIGLKMLCNSFIHVSTLVTLSFVALILLLSALLSKRSGKGPHPRKS
jgi:tellurite resistance protein TerC